MNTAIVITFLTRCLYFIWVIFLNPHGSPNPHCRCKNQDMDRWGNSPEIMHVRQNQCWKPGAWPQGPPWDPVWRLSPPSCGYCQATCLLLRPLDSDWFPSNNENNTGQDGFRWLRKTTTPPSVPRVEKKKMFLQVTWTFQRTSPLLPLTFGLVPETVSLESKVCVGSYESQWSWLLSCSGVSGKMLVC